MKKFVSDGANLKSIESICNFAQKNTSSNSDDPSEMHILAPPWGSYKISSQSMPFCSSNYKTVLGPTLEEILEWHDESKADKNFFVFSEYSNLIMRQ